MSDKDVVQVIDLVEWAGIQIWLNGGWGIDDPVGTANAPTR